MLKACNRCHKNKDQSEFSSNPATKDKLSYYCKKCLKEYVAKYRERFPEHNMLQSLIQRCENPENPSYQYYGGKGIKVCESWKKFKTFLADVGKRPSKRHTLVRLDETKGYEPGNCKWKLRGYWGVRFSSRTLKLSLDNVKKIKKGLASGVAGSTLAKRFGVTRACVSLIKTNQTWRAA